MCFPGRRERKAEAVKRTWTILLLTLLILILSLALLRSGLHPPGGNTGLKSFQNATDTKPEPAQEPDMVQQALEKMSREEMAWQMLVVFPRQLTGRNETDNGLPVGEALACRPAGGLIFDAEEMPSEADLRGTLAVAGCSGKNGIVPFLCVDEEGGSVARVAYNLGCITDFKPMFTYRDGGEDTAYRNANTIGSEIRALGFNMDMAPVADVWTNPANTVIGKRAYSDEPAEAAALVAAAVRGFRDSGVLCVLKHFPGHGDTEEDSHAGAAYSGRTLEELRACEFLPFSAGIEAGADLVMVGHITLTEVDPDTPATLSAVVVNSLLREELGFRDGVVITDAMNMAALGGLSETEAAVRAVEAGCDLLLAPDDPDAVVQALLEHISDARLEESVRRILRLKAERGLLIWPKDSGQAPPD